MKKLMWLPIAAMLIACSYSATQTAISKAFNVNQTTWQKGHDLAGMTCLPMARECKKRGDTECVEGRKCLAVYRKFVWVSSAIDSSLYSAQQALKTGDKEGAAEKFKYAMQRAAALAEILMEFKQWKR